jgi:hypothetical protein
MSHIHVATELTINAQPKTVYEILSDYKTKRPLMLTPNFLDYIVAQGGKGAGTEVHYRLHAAGRERPYHLRIDVPMEGRIITERDRNSSLVTTWTLDPVNDGQRTKVSVDSEWEGGEGVGGFFERTFAPMGLTRIYDDMLYRLSILLLPPEQRETALVDANTTAKPNLLLVLSGSAVVAAGVVIMLKLRNNHNT